MISTIALPYPQSSIELLQKIKHLPLPVMLSSGISESENARFDIIAAAPEKILRTQAGITQIELSDGTFVAESAKPIDALAKQFTSSGFDETTDEELPFTGGAIGYFSYDLLHSQYRIESQSDDLGLPEMLVGIYYWALIVDHHKQTCTVVFRPECKESCRADVLECLKAPVPPKIEPFALKSAFKSNFTQQEYIKAYQRIIDYIHAGDCYQVNLSQRFSASSTGDSFLAFKHLQEKVNAPFSSYIADGENSVLSFSPERFLKVDNKAVLTEPIKGTRPRDDNPVLDRENLEELKNSSKDKAENLMIVDLLRNDLGRVCKTGSVEVSSLFDAHSFKNVHHLISSINGELNHASEVFKLLEASFPGGSITGTPKIRAMEIIDELETRARSVYCGSIAYIDFNGNMDSNICIRTLVCDGESIHCWGGGAIVVDSDGEQEYQETLDKISIFMDNL